MTQPSHQKGHSTYSSVLAGSVISGMITTTIVHPLDLVKVRMQLYPGSITAEAMARKIVHYEGLPAMFNGLSAAFLRHATFTTTRLAVYYGVYEKYTQVYGVLPGLADKVNIGLYSSLVGSLAGNPSEVALVRMMADGSRDPSCTKEHCKTYRGAFHALYKTEGFWALWRGGTLTLTRSACISVIQIGSYSQARVYFQEHGWATPGQRPYIHAYASILSGFLTALITLPVDTLKTNYQIRTDDMSQKGVFIETLRIHGVSYLWQGFVPYFTRLTLHTTITYYILQEIRTFSRAFGVFAE